MLHLIGKLTIIFLLLNSFLTNAVGQYRFNIWTTENGLPQNTVNGILQSQDGFLWFTTNDGIVRFDGVKFKVFNKSNTKGLTTSRFNKSFEDKSGKLWFKDGDDHLVLYDQGIFTTFTKENGLPVGQINSIFHDAQGGIFFTSEEGNYRYAGGGEFVPFEIEGVSPSAEIIYTDSQGGIWFVDQNILRKNINRKTLDILKTNAVSSWYLKIFEDKSGNFWLGEYKKPLRRFREGKFEEFEYVFSSPDSPFFAEDTVSNLWIGSGDELVSLKLKNFDSVPRRKDIFSYFTKDNGLSGEKILSICGGREGSLWIGTTKNGLTQMTPKEIEVFSSKDWNSPDESVYPVFEDAKENVWLGVWSETLVKYSGGIFSAYKNADLVASIFEDSGGNLWVAKAGGVFIFENGGFQNMNKSIGLPDISSVLTINEDRRKNMWFGTGKNGLVRSKDAKAEVFTTKDGLPGNEITAFLELKNGKICVGTRDGLAFFENGKFTALTEKDGLTGNYVRSLYEDADGVLWIGTYDSGLFRYKDGNFTNFNPENGLHSKNVFCILEDENNWFWMNSNTGIYRVSRESLKEFADGKSNRITSIAYTKKDGLLNAEGNGEKQPAGIKRSNGELWFPTLGGVAVVKPSKISLNTIPPPVHFDDVLIDGENIGRYADTITLEPEQESIEINYTGLSFINSELVKFRYILEGFDKKWTEAGTRRFAFYTNLSPGEYTFRLQAANRDGIWNKTGKSLKIIVQPHFYETLWFEMSAVSLIAGLILFAYFYRVSKIKQIARAKTHFAKQLIESQEAERKRIAVELHDGLGQSLVIIKNRAILGKEERDFEEYAEISDTAANALGEVREIIYNLRPQHLERIGLTRSIKAMLKRAGGILEYETEIDSIDGLFPPDEEIIIYRLIQECLNNIIKHSEAPRAEFTVKKEFNHISIKIEDNGKGFDTNSNGKLREGFGLVGIKERVDLLNGEFYIESETGKGTNITIKLPIHGAK